MSIEIFFPALSKRICEVRSPKAVLVPVNILVAFNCGLLPDIGTKFISWTHNSTIFAMDGSFTFYTKGASKFCKIMESCNKEIFSNPPCV